MLNVEGITKSFGAVPVLEGVDFAISPGEMVGLIGASGSGKTVFAKCLVGLIHADSGSHTLDGETRSLPSGRARQWNEVRRKVGYVSQARALPPYRTITQLVAEGPFHVLGMPKADAIGRAWQLLDRFDLSSHREKYPGEVSGGQLARVCLARALAMSPRYLICDEVTANLDPIASAAVGDILLEARENGVGLIIISHQLGLIREHADRLDFIDGGKIVCSGDAKSLVASPENASLEAFLKADKIAF